MLHDLGNPHPARIAKVLGVSVRTVYRWKLEAQMECRPSAKAAALALFWLTRWGQGHPPTDGLQGGYQCAAVTPCSTRLISKRF